MKPAIAKLHPTRAIDRYTSAFLAVLRDVRDAVVGQARPHHDAVDSTAIGKPPVPGLDVDALAAELVGIGEETETFQAQALGKVLGIDLDDIRLAQWSDGARPAIDAFVQENVERITTVAEEMKGELEQVIADSFAAGERSEDLAERIAEQFGVSESDAARIAFTETSQLNADLNEERQKDLGITKFIWRCADPCPVCDEFDGETYDWEAPPNGTPPGYVHPWCKCYADPVLPEDLAALKEAA